MSSGIFRMVVKIGLADLSTTHSPSDTLYQISIFPFGKGEAASISPASNLHLCGLPKLGVFTHDKF